MDRIMDFKLKMAAPSAISALSMFTGLASLALSARGNFDLAAWCIVYSTFLDKADGTVARALDVSSRFGMEMDSFSDLIAFGIAPAALTWFAMADNPAVPPVWVAVSSLTYVLLAAIRLARFNIDTDDQSDCFTGVPSTLAAGLCATLFLSLSDLGMLERWSQVMVPALVALGILMVSGLRIPKVGPGKSRFMTVLQAAVMLFALGLAIARTLPEVLFALSFGFLVIGGVASTLKGGSTTDESG